jgi:hypothetical protein
MNGFGFTYIAVFLGFNVICKTQSLLNLYMIMIIHRLSIYTSMKPSLLSLKHLALALNSLDTLSDIRIKAFTLLS